MEAQRHLAVGESPLSPAPAEPKSEPGGDISELTSKQRAHLRSEAHDLKAILQVGTSGVTDPVIEAVEEAFNTRELLKVKVLDGAPEDVDEAADAIRDALDDVHVIQTIGKTMVLYRPHPDEPEIELPA